ncbi:hypothetical protein FB548_1523 [Pseudoxanthomonas sp. 3HH-4]|nr:hypothetical protein FB548_1523 [Pseudoxanthomonas sp. 3HH-4]
MRGALASTRMRTKRSQRVPTDSHRLKLGDSARPSPAFGTHPGRAQRARRSNDLRGMPRKQIVLTPVRRAREWMTDAS